MCCKLTALSNFIAVLCFITSLIVRTGISIKNLFLDHANSRIIALINGLVPKLPDCVRTHKKEEESNVKRVM